MCIRDRHIRFFPSPRGYLLGLTQVQVHKLATLLIVLRTYFCNPYVTGTPHTQYNQTVLQTQKLPQHKPQLMSLQLVAQPGFEPGSLAHQSLASVYLHG
eukprot:2434469-Ditylum_brightwellii.AAC.1